jgi:hypothetical protein
VLLPFLKASHDIHNQMPHFGELPAQPLLGDLVDCMLRLIQNLLNLQLGLLHEADDFVGGAQKAS